MGLDTDLFTLVDNKLSFASAMLEKNPLDADKDGIYELLSNILVLGLLTILCCKLLRTFKYIFF